MGKPDDRIRLEPTDAAGPVNPRVVESSNFTDVEEDNDNGIGNGGNSGEYRDLPPSYDDDSHGTIQPRSSLLLAVDSVDFPYFDRDVTTGTLYYIDYHLSSAPRALSRHIEQLAAIPPRPRIRIVGTHTTTVHKNNNGKSETERKTVTDFDVQVDLTPYLYSDTQYRRSWSELSTVENHEKTYRGTILRARAPGADSTGSVRLPLSNDENKAGADEWYHRFCASHAGLKCFTLRREMTGFDFPPLKEKLVTLVRNGTGYRGRLNVELETHDGRVEIYNDARPNRWRRTRWIWWLFVLSFLWIFTWPYLWLRTKRWEVMVVQWPFSRAIPGGGRSGVHAEYVSLTEDQWYNMWAQPISKAVLGKEQKMLDQDDLRRAQEPDPRFDSQNGMAGFVRAGIGAMNEVNRQLGWGFDN